MRALALLLAACAAPVGAISRGRPRLALRLTGGGGGNATDSAGAAPLLLDEARSLAAHAALATRGGGGGGGKNRQATRIKRELEEFVANPPDGCRVSVGKSLNVWVVTMTGPEGTIFAGEKYKLRVGFPADYPMSPPSCYFLDPTPRHPHVYTNGDICLDLLGRGWRPNLTVAQLALSILSMISSAKTKGIPPDNAIHAASPPGKAQDGWMYHDDSC